MSVANLGVPDSRVQSFSHFVTPVQGGPGVMGEDTRSILNYPETLPHPEILKDSYFHQSILFCK